LIEFKCSQFETNAQIGRRVGRIVSSKELIELRKQWRSGAKRVVLATGAFDLLHPGHVRLLEQARPLGDVLVVGVEDDSEVRASAENGAGKNGALSPVTPVAERAEILAALAAVDFVVELHGISAAAWIERLQPDIYVRGGTAESRDSEQTQGVRIVSIPLEPGYSTALLIERIQQLKQ
jgi:rfaE bifunctional protein nucleotidyltransferase chain/domain